MGKLNLTITTPERLILQEQVDEVIAPGSLGYFGVLPSHAPFLSQLKAGELSYRIDENKHFLWINGGYCEVLEDRVTILAHKARKIEEDEAKDLGKIEYKGMGR